MVLQAKNDQETASFCIIAYGSNLSSTLDLSNAPVEVALELLSSESLQIEAQSRHFRTPAFPPGSGPDFVNGAILCSTKFGPEQLLARLHQIEDTLGRTRNKRWEARVIDLDIIAFEGQIRPDRATYDAWKSLPLSEQTTRTPDQLILPHPRLQDRPFVLVPMHDIVPDWMHPVTGELLAEMIASFSAEELSEIRPILPG
ncbi:MAG: 2-amino-4-hydroxy-6-hydroxymethyldihydropteridine diphosphokinase [Rhodobacteraceae bacterium]|nr:2-amino-4-hydroxy-6-hydroxymethyldihydropteridine diphosphokinase [Paracoccaceae bacterium]